jgi:catechol 2,3-dioxygenase-like lactoylglutathione lyase family enzyme
MVVWRIVANIAAERLEDAKSFYGDLLGLSLVMDLGWIMTFAGALQAVPQISIATEGGSGVPVPDFSIEVDDFEAVLARVRAIGSPIEHGPQDEPWGVRRCYVRDPFAARSTSLPTRLRP